MRRWSAAVIGGVCCVLFAVPAQAAEFDFPNPVIYTRDVTGAVDMGVAWDPGYNVFYYKAYTVTTGFEWVPQMFEHLGCGPGGMSDWGGAQAWPLVPGSAAGPYLANYWGPNRLNDREVPNPAQLDGMVWVNVSQSQLTRVKQWRDAWGTISAFEITESWPLPSGPNYWMALPTDYMAGKLCNAFGQYPEMYPSQMTLANRPSLPCPYPTSQFSMLTWDATAQLLSVAPVDCSYSGVGWASPSPSPSPTSSSGPNVVSVDNWPSFDPIISAINAAREAIVGAINSAIGGLLAPLEGIRQQIEDGINQVIGPPSQATLQRWQGVLENGLPRASAWAGVFEDVSSAFAGLDGSATDCQGPAIPLPSLEVTMYPLDSCTDPGLTLAALTKGGLSVLLWAGALWAGFSSFASALGYSNVKGQ